MARKRVARLLALVAAVLALSAVMTACGGKKQQVSKVRLGEVTRSIFYAPLYVALSQGMFKQEGLDVELQTIPGGDKVATAVLSGGIDVGLVGAETTFYVAQQGSGDPLVNFAQMTQTDGTFLVARKPQTNFDWNNLKGSVFLGQRKGGMPQMAGEFTLKKKGIDPHKDLNLIQNIDYANIASAYASGTGEFVQLFEPQASMFEKEGKGYVIASFGKESGKLPYTDFNAKQSFIKSNPDTIQKFTNAIQRAQTWVQDRSVNEIADAVKSFFPDTDMAIARTVVQRYKEQGSFATDSIIDEDEWNNLKSVLTTAGELKGEADYKKLVDNTFADKAKSVIK